MAAVAVFRDGGAIAEGRPLLRGFRLVRAGVGASGRNDVRGREPRRPPLPDVIPDRVAEGGTEPEPTRCRPTTED
ncbi:hypothetical protein GCM10017083_14500 [Thalassobaculum fulvum]|uniref:Uncharacterized protein n=1 Tax=Thalassobaculum fulvum TaxID=1633335 RepID=A0A918XQ07_9PROT|nr:hypothetical protein GCM10017083_14500 [Thalassobaculum fulvum]